MVQRCTQGEGAVQVNPPFGRLACITYLISALASDTFLASILSQTLNNAHWQTTITTHLVTIVIATALADIKNVCGFN